MGFPILVRCHLYIESGPRLSVDIVFLISRSFPARERISTTLGCFKNYVSFSCKLPNFFMNAVWHRKSTRKMLAIFVYVWSLMAMINFDIFEGYGKYMKNRICCTDFRPPGKPFKPLLTFFAAKNFFPNFCKNSLFSLLFRWPLNCPKMPFSELIFAKNFPGEEPRTPTVAWGTLPHPPHTARHGTSHHLLHIVPHKKILKKWKSLKIQISV